MSIYLKKSILYFLLSVYCVSLGYSQKVDSVKVEQTGNYIKISYKILNSYPKQIFRVNVSCSVNGGLSGVIRNYSGDAGERVPGGKYEYMVLWDVFKDVDDVNSVEFVVKAELIEGKPSRLIKVNLSGWDKKKQHYMFIYQNHGPKFGAKIGYYGNWGIAGEFVFGKMNPEKADFSISSNDLPRKPYINLDVVKRLFNENELQGHLFLGISATPNIFANSQDLNDYQVKYLAGIHCGWSLAIKRVVFYLGSGFMPGFGRYEKDNDLAHITADTYVDFGFGLRF